MDGEQTFWFRVVGMIVVAITLVLMSMTGCTMHQHKRVADAIKNGVPPERARIAFSTQTTEMEKAVALITAYKNKGE